MVSIRGDPARSWVYREGGILSATLAVIAMVIWLVSGMDLYPVNKIPLVYSHSIVPGGLLVMSYTTRLTP